MKLTGESLCSTPFDWSAMLSCGIPRLRAFTDFMRIPVKWATDSANKWARVGRASRRGKNIIAEVAHFSQ